MTPVTISGVTYGIDSTERSLDDLGIDTWQMKFQNLEEDFFSYTVRTKNAKGLGTIVPNDGQELRVYVDGTRVFKGHVVGPKLGLDKLEVKAVGPWWWMKKIMLSGGFTDDTGATADRTKYAFPEQGLRKSFRSLINRAVELGVPMADIDNDTEEAARMSGMFPVMKQSLSNMSFAAAFSDLMTLIPDAVLWFDYAAAPVQLRITRRADMTPISYAVGGTGSVRVERAEIFPRGDQQVARVELKHMTRSTTTKRAKFATQASGSSTAGKVQIVTVSGPEIVPFLPKDDLDSMVVQTEQVRFSMQWARAFDSVIQNVERSFGTLPGTISDGGAFAGAYRLMKGEVTDWMRKQEGLKVSEKRISGWVRMNYNYSLAGIAPVTQLRQMGRIQNHTASDGYYLVFVDFTVPILNKSFPTKKTLYQNPTYNFIAPPTGLAAELKSAQDWLPWEGPVTIVRDDLSLYNGLPRTFNLTGSHPSHASMNALVRSISYSSARRVVWDLGAPPRIDTGSLVNKLRRNPQDAIEYL